MKPVMDTSNYSTMDLTRCDVHVKPDGSLVALVPMKWEKMNERPIVDGQGRPSLLTIYTVKEFKEVVLAPPGTATQPS